MVCHFSLLPIIIPIARHLHLPRYHSHIFTDCGYAIDVSWSSFSSLVWRIRRNYNIFLHLFSWLTLHNYPYVLSLFHQAPRPSYTFYPYSKFDQRSYSSQLDEPDKNDRKILVKFYSTAANCSFFNGTSLRIQKRFSSSVVEKRERYTTQNIIR